MSSSIDKFIPEAQEALRGFLSTLLGEEAPLKVDAPVATSMEAVRSEERRMLNILGSTEPGFAIRLSPQWLPLLSKAMLGEEVSAGEEGYEDLVSELMGQAYGAVRTQLSGAGVTLPDVSFKILPPEESFPEGSLPDTLWSVSCHMELGGETLEGTVLLPQLPETTPPEPGSPAASAQPTPASVPVAPLQFPDLGQETFGDGGHPFGLLADVELEVTVELGRRRLPLADILRLTSGSVIELEKLVGEPLDIYANGRFIAQGEAVVIDEQFGIRITTLATPRRADKAIR
ncbi:flagellar motor switch protein FliN [Rhodocaloribacter sp.]